MRTETLSILQCPGCKDKRLRLTPFAWELLGAVLSEGVLTCEGCKTWFPVIRKIPVMFSEEALFRDLKTKFAEQWKSWHEFSREPAVNAAILHKAPSKMGQISHYAKDSAVYDELVSNSPFWQASDWNTLGRWLERIQSDALLLDLGCGTGRCSIPAVRKGARVIGMDISFEMVERAVEKAAKAGLSDRCDFLVGDVEVLPFQSCVFDVAIGFGILHHVENPSEVVGGVAKILKPAGTFYGLENNKSQFRFLFDWLMAFKKLWNEEAGAHPLLSREEVAGWAQQSGMSSEIVASTFFPPHLFNLFKIDTAKTFLESSDRFCSRISWLKDQGGQLVICFKKNPSTETGNMR
jgi:ubiquinone/menaquinone biosynthesis C-methylase UbiE/uncharacterized protein YbaR (Trm112 family)